MTIPRIQCPRCAIKHLAQAAVLLKEVKKGYPEHVWLALGHMAEAEDEIVELLPGETALIRGARKSLETALDAGSCITPNFSYLMRQVALGATLMEVSLNAPKPWWKRWVR